MDLISVIVPIYNGEKHLGRCVRSIVNQSYTDLEILLINDGSTDRSGDICDQWALKDSRVRVIHKSNGGVSSARNAGLDNSDGRYILQIDSDDYIHPDMVSILYHVLVSNDADISICDLIRGKEEEFELIPEDKLSVEILNGIETISRIYDSKTDELRYVVPWCKLYKKELFDGIRYPDGKIFEDIYVTHQVLYRCNRIAVIPDKLVYYYQHPESIMNTAYNVKKLDYLQALKERIAFFHEKQLGELEEIAYDEYLHALIWEYSRARDLLNSKPAMKDIKARFREIYKKGYASKRYPKETSRFLSAFGLNPELIIFYWKVSGRINRLFKR